MTRTPDRGESDGWGGRDEGTRRIDDCIGEVSFGPDSSGEEEDEIMTTDGGRAVNDHDEYNCEFCEIARPEASALKAHLIAEHKREIASRHWAQHVEVELPIPDGGESA